MLRATPPGAVTTDAGLEVPVIGGPFRRHHAVGDDTADADDRCDGAIGVVAAAAGTRGRVRPPAGSPDPARERARVGWATPVRAGAPGRRL